jgi:hypothetical protein
MLIPLLFTDVSVSLPKKHKLSFLASLIARSAFFSQDEFNIEPGINRAIPDADFEAFVDRFARRVAGWDHYAIAAAKRLINGRTGFPTADQQQESFNSFVAAASQGAVPARLKALAAAGLQTDLKFEINLSEEELKFVGDGPWDI